MMHLMDSSHKQLNILTPKQMLQILLIALVQVTVGKISENFLNEIKKIIYFLNKLLKEYITIKLIQ